MAASNPKPNAIIFGGLNTCSRALAVLLIPVEGESLVSHLRIVDKYTVQPATTYLDSEFKKVLEKPNVEYRQGNLANSGVVSTSFDPPEGQEPYDYVFDLTGEVIQDRTEHVYINHTLSVACLLGREAAKRKVKAYIRLQQPWYETPEQGSHDEKVDVKPLTGMGIWWHESLRALGAIPDLNLVILRIGFVYGPYINFGVFNSIMIVAAVYAYMGEPMKSLYSPGKNPMYSVHIDDVTGGLWAAAEWMKSLGRKEADSLAGEEIIFHNKLDKIKDIADVAPHDQKIIAPLFNLTNDSKTTLVSAGKAFTSFFGTTFEFVDFFTSALSKFGLRDVAEQANEVHVGGWNQMVAASNPVPKTLLTAYMDDYGLSKHSIAFSNTKIQEVIGYKLKKPELNDEIIKEIVDKWKAEGYWPDL